VKPDSVVAVEDPGYPDMRNIFALQTRNVRAVPLDAEGIRVDGLEGAELAFVTPSHQAPTNVTMSLERRKQLLEWASRSDALIVEDDYESETRYSGVPTPALKSLDGGERVVYIGSLSKSLMPGLRMGFLVAAPELVRELRALRRLVLRHPPGNNQRITTR
jgi:GntR family transcriptional regulator / MocR family aminotransferase